MWLAILSLPAFAGSMTVCASYGPDCDIVGLQEAIDRADDGDLLVLAGGRYEEDVVIDTSIELRSDSDAVIVGLGWSTALVEVGDADVGIEGIQIGTADGPPELRIKARNSVRCNRRSQSVRDRTAAT